jgi:tRNA A-37 threonylcarbamoyl transferase component Bud32
MFSHFLRKLGSLGPVVSNTDTRTVRTGGRKWHLTPDATAAFGPDGPDLDRWLADGLAEVVKSGPHRTVYRVTLPGGTVYVKRCRVSGPRAWAREVLRPAKARLEFENARTLRDRGIAAVVPLAWGGPDSHWPGESVLITLSRDGVVPFVSLLEEVLPTSPAAVRRQVAHSLGQFFARLHDTGVAHPDPHPGNLLVELPPSGVPRFCLIDLHAVRITRPLSWADSQANLVLFNRWFQLRASRTDRLRFWYSYRHARQTLAPSAAEARGVERGTLQSNLRFWVGRVSRCLGGNRYFRTVKAGSLHGHVVRDLPEAVVRDLLADPDAMFTRPGVRILKDSRTSTVAEIVLDMPGGPRPVILKRVNVRRGLEPLKNLLRPSAVRRSWVSGHAIRDRWLPTPRPLAAFHRYRHGLPAEGYLLTEKVPDALGLPEAVAGLAPGTRLLRTWSHRLARTIRTMHDRGVSHRDLKAPNLLLEGAATDPAGAVPVLIDLVGVRLGEAVSFRQRAKELARLNASFLHKSTTMSNDGGSSPPPIVGEVADRRSAGGGGLEASSVGNAPPTRPAARADLPHQGGGKEPTGLSVSLTEKLRFLRTYLTSGENLERGWKAWWTAIGGATAEKVAKNRRSGRELK